MECLWEITWFVEWTYITNSVGGEEVKAASRFELHTFPIEYQLGFWIVCDVKVALIIVYYS